MSDYFDSNEGSGSTNMSDYAGGSSNSPGGTNMSDY